MKPRIGGPLDYPSRIQLTELRPRPCCGVHHKHLAEILACIEKHGVPGFEAIQVLP
jgi:hypothetical protein